MTVHLFESEFQYPVNTEQLEYPVKGPKVINLGLHAEFDYAKEVLDELTAVLKVIRPKEDRDGHHMIIHDPFEIPSEKSWNFFTMPNRTVEYLINPIILQMDDSLKKFKPRE
jgi:hypothetical protein